MTMASFFVKKKQFVRARVNGKVVKISMPKSEKVKDASLIIEHITNS